jgi:hypothetical protein
LGNQKNAQAEGDRFLGMSGDHSLLSLLLALAESKNRETIKVQL